MLAFAQAAAPPHPPTTHTRTHTQTQTNTSLFGVLIPRHRVGARAAERVARPHERPAAAFLVLRRRHSAVLLHRRAGIDGTARSNAAQSHACSAHKSHGTRTCADSMIFFGSITLWPLPPPPLPMPPTKNFCSSSSLSSPPPAPACLSASSDPNLGGWRGRCGRNEKRVKLSQHS